MLAGTELNNAGITCAHTTWPHRDRQLKASGASSAQAALGLMGSSTGQTPNCALEEWLILCYVNFTSKKQQHKNKKKNTWAVMSLWAQGLLMGSPGPCTKELQRGLKHMLCEVQFRLLECLQKKRSGEIYHSR